MTATYMYRLSGSISQYFGTLIFEETRDVLILKA